MGSSGEQWRCNAGAAVGMQTPPLREDGDDPLRQWLCDRHADPGHRQHDQFTPGHQQAAL